MEGMNVLEEIPETRAKHASNLRPFVIEIINNIAIYSNEPKVMDYDRERTISICEN